MRILNLHGYGSCSENAVCQALRASGYDVISPQIEYETDPEQLLCSLYDIYEEAQCTAVSGSSMGGFFAIQLSVQTGCPAVLVNPCILPQLVLPEIGNVPQTALLQYIRMSAKLADLDLTRTYAVLGMRDELLTTHGLVRCLLGDAHCVLVPDGQHRGSSLPLPEIFRAHSDAFFR